MPKNIIICLDGTWNNSISGSSQPTNVYALYTSASVEGQVKLYWPGVGSDRGWLSQRLDGIVGKGVFQTARAAWQQVAANFAEGDKLFILGFSRGAYAARHLAGMIVRRGLKGWQGSLELQFRDYLSERQNPDPPVIQPVHFLGLFDCVPGNRLYMIRDRNFDLNSDVLESGIHHFRHAVSADERRWSFKPLLFRKGNQLSFSQMWFPGSHSDVGGGDKVSDGLSRFSLWWMLREAFGLGLDFDNVSCSRHRFGHTLSVLRGLDPKARPTQSEYLTTRLGLRWNRKKRLKDVVPLATPEFQDLDLCPRCSQEMFDYFLTDAGQSWLAEKGFSQ